ncbi:MAG TPA: CRISPR-associated endonuclease Cas3'' [Elusimicrobiales bacterium]|nr:CRISPR-associated endonuclease Cas3'' [Elusimicrobiales bacterium]
MSKEESYYAHTKRALDGTPAPKSDWQPLEEHLNNVAELASGFARDFASSEWGYFAGLLHDLGKASPQFQKYLENGMGKVEHSGQGAAFAEDNLKKVGRILAYLIAGHHAGLPDWHSTDTGSKALAVRLKNGRELLPDLGDYQEKFKARLAGPLTPPGFKRPEDVHLWMRMLFSALTDADYLDTENFMAPEAKASRQGFNSIRRLSEAFLKHLDVIESKSARSAVNSIRAEVRRYCEVAADKKPGIFSLTVPTGGGKTLSSMAFAFRHALKYGKKRIIYVIPYTSIIEQTAKVLSDILGPENIVEHHSNLEPKDETEATRRSKLASENWDAPVIVTTNVQFFESLYAARPGRCRKLHNLVGSIIILDEAQLLPPHLLSPCVDAMRQLAENYGATLVISTATQPALKGLGHVEEIIPDAARLYSRLKRVNYFMPTLLSSPPTSLEEVSVELQKYEQVLCIVNTRPDCYKLFKLMPEGTVHLSALMCGAHRSEVIAGIKERLKNNLPVRVISTQLVEAGVDIDFPVVYRAFAGLDAIAQAAGRCNREGGKSTKGAFGQVHVFVPPSPLPIGIMRKSADTFRDLLATGGFDPDSPGIYKRYFEALYSRANSTDSAGIMELLTKDIQNCGIQFRTAAEKFRLIDDYSRPVVIRYGGAEKLLARLRETGPNREIMRGLQRYIVNVPEKKLLRMAAEDGVSEVSPGVWVQERAAYNQATGLDIFTGLIEPEELMA